MVAQKRTAMSVKAGMGAGRRYAEQGVGQWRVSGKCKHHELSRAQERHKKRKGKRKGGTDHGASGPREGCLWLGLPCFPLEAPRKAGLVATS